MLCPNCGVTNDFGRDMCKSCGANLTGVGQDLGYGQPEPSYSQDPSDREEILGGINNAYRGHLFEYYTIFFTENYLLVARLGAIDNPIMEFNIYKSYKISQRGNKAVSSRTKGEVLRQFPNAQQIHRYYINQILLRKKLTEATIEIDFSMGKDQNGIDRKSSIKLGFPKKIFDDVKNFLEHFYSDKLAIK
jgi:hypothetical protein